MSLHEPTTALIIASNILARGTEGGVQFRGRALNATCPEAEQVRPEEEPALSQKQFHTM